jgi:hypothetical protein
MYILLIIQVILDVSIEMLLTEEISLTSDELIELLVKKYLDEVEDIHDMLIID